MVLRVSKELEHSHQEEELDNKLVDKEMVLEGM